MNNLVKFLPHAGIIACLAFICIYGCSFAPAYLVSWAIFQTWALYFIAGATPKAGLRAMVCYMLGVLASVLIFWLAGMLGGSNPVVAVVGALVTFTVICMEKAPYIDYIPAYFIGAGAYFALSTINMPSGNATPGFQILVMLITCLAGSLLGYATVVFRTMYANFQAQKEAAAAPPAQAVPQPQEVEA